MEEIKEKAENFEAVSLRRERSWDDVTDIQFFPREDVTLKMRTHQKGEAKRFLGIKYGTYKYDTYSYYDYSVEEFLNSENFYRNEYAFEDGKLFKNAVVKITRDKGALGTNYETHFFNSDAEAYEAFERIRKKCVQAGVKFIDRHFKSGKGGDADEK